MSIEIKADTSLGEDVPPSSPIFLATLKERICLNPGSNKKTYHLVLCLDGFDCVYSVGDCVGIYPQNDSLLVESILNRMGCSGEEMILNRENRHQTLRSFLIHKANLNKIPPQLGGGNFFDFIHSTHLNPQEFCNHFLPMLPRFYSIASSMLAVKQEVHLTVSLTENDKGAFFPYGTCSYFLCCKAEIGIPCIPLFHKPAKHFNLPEHSFDKPLIMIGPGTGIAPFRGFMQERYYRQARSQNWLFFGERHRKTDFYYKDFWTDLEAKGFLKVSCAFSRDQEEKIYVQHNLLENSREIWHWIREGGYIYVCGDAKHMAKDVDKALQLIVEKESGVDSENAKLFLRTLKKQGRYQRDVY